MSDTAIGGGSGGLDAHLRCVRGTSNIAGSVNALWVIVNHALFVEVRMALLLLVSMGILLPTSHMCAVYVSTPTHT